LLTDERNRQKRRDVPNISTSSLVGFPVLHDSVNNDRADDPVTEKQEDEFLVKLNAALGQDLDVLSLTFDEAAARMAMSKLVFLPEHIKNKIIT
jgi:hypothetical protein